MSSDLIVENLRRLRAEKGLSQEALAESAGLSRPAYRNIETRKSEPRAETLHRLATALGVGIKELVSPVPVLTHVRFRSLKRLKSRGQVVSAVARRLSDLNELERLVGEPREPAGPLRLPPEILSAHGVKRSTSAAEYVRREFGLEPSEPVRDICGLLAANGFRVILTKTASDAFFGLSVGAEDGGPAVVVNDWERISVERKIFSAAHELGHLLLHSGAYDVAEAEENKAEEFEANAFASQFLMPPGVFEREWDEAYGLPLVKRVLKVKRMFRVSYRTVLYRLGELHPESKRTYFIRFQLEHKMALGRPLLKADEPEGVDHDEFLASEPLRAGEPDELLPIDFENDRLATLVRRAVEKEAISLSRAAEILDKSLLEMRALTASWVQ